MVTIDCFHNFIVNSVKLKLNEFSIQGKYNIYETLYIWV